MLISSTSGRAADSSVRPVVKPVRLNSKRFGGCSTRWLGSRPRWYCLSRLVDGAEPLLQGFFVDLHRLPGLGSNNSPPLG
jgi:hypothetical protein